MFMACVAAIYGNDILFGIFNSVITYNSAFDNRNIGNSREGFTVIIYNSHLIAARLADFHLIFAYVFKVVIEIFLSGTLCFGNIIRVGYLNVETRSVGFPRNFAFGYGYGVYFAFPYGIKIDVLFQRFTVIFISEFGFVVEIADVPAVEFLSVFIRKRFETVNNAVCRLNLLVASVFKRYGKFFRTRSQLDVLSVNGQIGSYRHSKIVYFFIFRRSIPSDELFTLFFFGVGRFCNRLTVQHGCRSCSPVVVKRYVSVDLLDQRIGLTSVS